MKTTPPHKDIWGNRGPAPCTLHFDTGRWCNCSYLFSLYIMVFNSGSWTVSFNIK